MMAASKRELRGDVHVNHVVYDPDEEAELARTLVTYQPREPHEPFWMVFQMSESGDSAGHFENFDNPTAANRYAERLAAEFGCRLHKWSAPIVSLRGARE